MADFGEPGASPPRLLRAVRQDTAALTARGTKRVLFIFAFSKGRQKK